MLTRLLVITGFVSILPLSASHVTRADEVEALRASVAMAQRHVGSILLQERVEEKHKGSAVRTDEMTRRYVESVEQRRDEIIATVSPEDTRKIEELEHKYADRLARVSDMEKVAALNRDVSVERLRWIDFSMNRQRVEDKDLRPVGALLKANDINEMSGLALSRSQVVLSDVRRSTTMIESIDDLAVVGQAERFKPEHAWRSLGVVPARVLEEGYKLSVTGRSGQGLTYSVAYAADDREVAKFSVRPEFGYALTSWTSLNQKGEESMSIQFEDHREIGGLWIPFRSTQKWNAYGISEYSVRVVSVDSAQLNIQLEESLFEIPDGYRIQDTTPPAQD